MFSSPIPSCCAAVASILGEVFDVSKGEKYYGKKGAYKGFVGRDASRAFITGDFSEVGGQAVVIRGRGSSICPNNLVDGAGMEHFG